MRFTDAHPEIIGEGGDEAETPVAQLSRRRANSHPPSLHALRGQGLVNNSELIHSGHVAQQSDFERQEDFRPGPIRRTQTGYDSITNHQAGSAQASYPPSYGGAEINKTLPERPKSHMQDPNSAAAKVDAEMKAGEGMTLHKAASNLSTALQTHVPTSAPTVPSEPVTSVASPSQIDDELYLNTVQNAQMASTPSMPSPLAAGQQRVLPRMRTVLLC